MSIFQEHPQMPQPHAHLPARQQFVSVRQEPKRRKLTVASAEHITPKDGVALIEYRGKERLWRSFQASINMAISRQAVMAWARSWR